MRANITREGSEYKITSALTVGGRRKPRSRTIALTDCVCYNSQGEEIGRIARNAPKSRPRPTKRTTVVVDRYTSDISLMSHMGSIHDTYEGN